MKATLGTHSAMWLNLALGIFGAINDSGALNVLPPQWGWAATVFGLGNAALHAATGNAPIVGLPRKS